LTAYSQFAINCLLDYKKGEKMKTLYLMLALLFVLSLCVSSWAADIVSMPTANMVKAGEVDIADYYFFLDFPEPQPQFVRVQTLYAGLTDKLELDIHRYDLPEIAPEMLVIANYKILSENQKQPDLVIGAKDLAERAGHPAMPHKTSFYLSAAKTLNPPAPGMAPKLPIWRLHVSLGTEDPSLLGETRHEGIFGGIQTLLTPQIGAIVLHDGRDLITGLTITPNKSWPTIKGGTFGDHTWIGISYTWNMK
jgi:hypothetical protein